MRFAIALAFLILVGMPKGFSQNDLRIMFYNVENLFDTIDNPLKGDDDFLPQGFMRWTSWKYWEKLRNITRVITAVGEMQSPALVGLCEVENDSVMVDLTRRSPLRNQGYEYLITDSPDERGINVALLYQRHQFKLLDKAEYEIRRTRPNSRPTRNILHAVGELISGDTLDVLVAHLPSRSGGIKETEAARVESARVLRQKTDSILATRSAPRCIIMGDFNNPPDSKVLLTILGANTPAPPYQDHMYYNLCLHLSGNNEAGTYKYQGRWEVIDQFIVSGELLNDESNVHVNGQVRIFNADFLHEEDHQYYGRKPFRTSTGPRYLGGFSDHLPIYLDLTVKN